MINPSKVTNFNRTGEELEEFMLFSIVVAGKNAYQQAEKLEQLLEQGKPRTPFGWIRTMDMDTSLDYFLRSVKIGQYNRIASAFRGVAHFFKYNPDNDRHSPLKDIPINRLECIKGIGMKTARFFAIHSRSEQQYACLDTHILKWLGTKGHEVPKTTPQGEKYLRLETIFLNYCKQMNMTPAELDLSIWNEAQKNK